jgi:hypothetical protein
MGFSAMMCPAKSRPIAGTISVSNSTATHIKCYLDNQLVHDVTYPRYQALYAVASRANKSREVILKVVNTSLEAQETSVQLGGARPGPCGNRHRSEFKCVGRRKLAGSALEDCAGQALA